MTIPQNGFSLPPMRWNAWMKLNGKTPEAVSADLDGKYSEGAITKWERGERTPRKQAQIDLMTYTAGEVTPNDWVLEETAVQ